MLDIGSGEMSAKFLSLIETYKVLIDLRTGMTEKQDWEEQLGDLSNRVSEMEKEVDGIARFIMREKEALSRATELSRIAILQADEIAGIENNIPATAPQSRVEKRTLSATADGNAAGSGGGGALARTGKRAKKSGGVMFSVPRVPMLSEESLEGVPHYIKGRLTYEKLCAGIEEINTIVSSRMKLMGMSTAKMSNVQLARYKVYAEEGTDEVNSNSPVFSEYDLKNASIVKLGDATGKSILQVLRHRHCIKEVRGGKCTRFVVTGE
jgi:hypothetical protein